MPAIQSSAMMPKPPGSDSACRAGKRLPNIEDAKKYKAQQQIFPVEQRHTTSKSYRQMRRESCVRLPTSWPDTSSITTICGSFRATIRAAARRPTTPDASEPHEKSARRDHCTKCVPEQIRQCGTAKQSVAIEQTAGERAPGAGRFRQIAEAEGCGDGEGERAVCAVPAVRAVMSGQLPGRFGSG